MCSVTAGGTRGREYEVKSLKYNANCWTLEFIQGPVTSAPSSEDTLCFLLRCECPFQLWGDTGVPCWTASARREVLKRYKSRRPPVNHGALAKGSMGTRVNGSDRQTRSCLSNLKPESVWFLFVCVFWFVFSNLKPECVWVITLKIYIDVSSFIKLIVEKIAIEQIMRETNLCVIGNISTFLQILCPPGSLELLTTSVQMGIWTLFALTWGFWLWVLDYFNKLLLKKWVYRCLSGTCALPSRRKSRAREAGMNEVSFFFVL